MTAPRAEYRCVHAVTVAPLFSVVRCPQGCLMWVREEPVYPLRVIIR